MLKQRGRTGETEQAKFCAQFSTARFCLLFFWIWGKQNLSRFSVSNPKIGPARVGALGGLILFGLVFVSSGLQILLQKCSQLAQRARQTCCWHAFTSLYPLDFRCAERRKAGPTCPHFKLRSSRFCHEKCLQNRLDVATLRRVDRRR